MDQMFIAGLGVGVILSSLIDSMFPYRVRITRYDGKWCWWVERR